MKIKFDSILSKDLQCLFSLVKIKILKENFKKDNLITFTIGKSGESILDDKTEDELLKLVEEFYELSVKENSFEFRLISSYQKIGNMLILRASTYFVEYVSSGKILW